LTKLLRNRSGLTKHSVTCAYCQHQREYMMMKSELPFEGVEHIWCPKCSRTFKYDRGTDHAYTIEDIQMIQEKLI
jgi:uncharacterized Zn-finger protein